MSKVRIELNREGVRNLMKSPEMQAMLLDCASSVSKNGDKEVYVAQTRAVVEVRGDDGKNGLLKSTSKKR